MDNLLEESAEISRLESDNCDGCNWYHGLWQTFRLLNVVVSAEQHREYYTQQLESIQPEHVMISGTSDYAMLSIVKDALPDSQVMVVDKCSTPLKINQWYAEKKGYNIGTKQSDIIDMDSTGWEFDCVITDCLFTFIHLMDRVETIRKWRSLLKTGGRFIMVNRLREKDDEQKEFTDEEKHIFMQKVLEAPELPDTGKGFLTWCAHIFVNNFRYYHTDESIIDLFLENGFEIEELHISGENTDSSAPSTTGDARRVYMTMRAI